MSPECSRLFRKPLSFSPLPLPAEIKLHKSYKTRRALHTHSERNHYSLVQETSFNDGLAQLDLISLAQTGLASLPCRRKSATTEHEQTRPLCKSLSHKCISCIA